MFLHMSHVATHKSDKIGHERASHGSPRADIKSGRSCTLQGTFYKQFGASLPYIWPLLAQNGAHGCKNTPAKNPKHGKCLQSQFYNLDIWNLKLEALQLET